MFTTSDKKNIVDLLMARYASSGFSSKSKFATTLGLHASDMTNLEKGNYLKTPHLIGVAKWIRIAKYVDFQKNNKLLWKTAKTYVYNFITAQLEACQQYGMTGIMADCAGIGKTHTAKDYAKAHKDVFYMDCSMAPRKNYFVRSLARSVGVGEQGKIEELVGATIYALQQTERPIIILDEGGDIDDLTMLLVKRLYNALEDDCGFYMIGSDGLKRKIERGLQYKKLGYAEFFSRFSGRFISCMPLELDERMDTLKEMAMQIAEVNEVPKKNIYPITSTLWDRGLGDIRRVKKEIVKYQAA